MLRSKSPSSEQAKMLQLSRIHSYWRVLNLHDIKLKRSQQHESGIPADSLFFRTEGLANSVFTKHLVKDHEKSNFEDATFSATKVISPLNGENFENGAFVFFLEETNLKEQLQQRYGLESNTPEGQRDLEVLTLLSQSPTLDLFILSELIDFNYYGISDLYVAESKIANSEMRNFITTEMRPLVSLAVGEVNQAQLDRFVESIFGPEIRQQAMQFLSLIGIPEHCFTPVIFSWKAQLYYEHCHRDLMQRAITTYKWLTSVQFTNYDESNPSSLVNKYWGSLSTNFRNLTSNCQTHMRAMDRNKREQFLKTADVDGLREYLLDMQSRVGLYANGFSVLEQMIGLLAPLRKQNPERLEASEAIGRSVMANGLVNQYLDFLD